MLMTFDACTGPFAHTEYQIRGAFLRRDGATHDNQCGDNGKNNESDHLDSREPLWLIL